KGQKMNKEAIDGLKRKVRLLEGKIKRVQGRKEHYSEALKEEEKILTETKNELEGLKEILEPFLVAEEL
ncbi:MAG: hypothetical protein WD512_00960, partial [Candidatus Paceibacterota bacterium]